MEKILELKNVSKIYSGNDAPSLQNVEFSVKEGEIIGVIGPSGAGKSTLLRCINRLVEPSEGQIYLENKEITKMNNKQMKYARRRVGMIFQHYNLVGRLTVMQNVMHGRLGYMSTADAIFGNYSEVDKRHALELLEMTGLKEFRYHKANDLSGGQKQRVGIVRALMQEPCILLCDEPIASLDPASARVVMELIRDLCREKQIACIVNLHQVDVAMEYTDRIIGMNRGKIVYNGDAKKLSGVDLERIYGKPMGELIVGGERANA